MNFPVYFFSCWPFCHLCFRLSELNFNVKTYSNSNKEEVFNKITEGEHRFDHLHSNDSEQQDNCVRYNMWDAVEATFTCSLASLSNTWCPSSRKGRPFRCRLLFARLPEPRQQWWQDWWQECSSFWWEDHSGYHIPVQRRQVQEPCGKAKDLHITGMQTMRIREHAISNLKNAVKVKVALSVTRHPEEKCMTI